MRVLVALAWLLALVIPAEVSAQPATVPSRLFAGPVDSVWEATLAALKTLGWNIEEKNQASGAIVTDSRPLEFQEYGVYAVGTRHKLHLAVKAAGDGRTAVTVEREVYREERILWMPNRKPVEAPDQKAEAAVLDAIETTVPAVAAAPPAPPAPVPPPAPAAPAAPVAPPVAAPVAPPPRPTPGPSAVAPPGSSRGEFTYKVTYRVRGTAGSVVLTYRNARGGTEQSSARLPWELTFDAKGGSFLYVSAQNQGVTGSVTCEILLDDESRTSSTSSGAYVIAECSNAAERN